MNVKFQPTDPENVIKYLLIDMLTHSYQSMMNYSDADMMNLFDGIYHNYITEDTVLYSTRRIRFYATRTASL